MGFEFERNFFSDIIAGMNVNMRFLSVIRSFIFLYNLSVGLSTDIYPQHTTIYVYILWGRKKGRKSGPIYSIFTLDKNIALREALSNNFHASFLPVHDIHITICQI